MIRAVRLSCVKISLKTSEWTLNRPRGGASSTKMKESPSTAGRNEIPHGATSQIQLLLSASRAEGYPSIPTSRRSLPLPVTWAEECEM